MDLQINGYPDGNFFLNDLWTEPVLFRIQNELGDLNNFFWNDEPDVPVQNLNQNLPREYPFENIHLVENPF